ncbi:ParA family protein [Hyphomicrobium sp.]|uniref:ParA family protein n=1 Tax=Hyphomicrobium sp. TaxID=82 RepID=UPI002FE185F9
MKRSNSKCNVIAVMNTKGGVGKSTVALALAETLAFAGRLHVLVVDGDSQASISYLLAGPEKLTELQATGCTLVDFLNTVVIQGTPASWHQYVVDRVSDVDGINSISLLPSDSTLTLLEREVSKEQQETFLVDTIRMFLGEVSLQYDFVIIDCAPGLSVVTEAWLRCADLHVCPTKPDYISACGLAFFQRFKEFQGVDWFARNIGVIITMYDRNSLVDREYADWLKANAENVCFSTIIPRLHTIQHSSSFVAARRSYAAKYPGSAGRCFNELTGEFLTRHGTISRNLQNLVRN